MTMSERLWKVKEAVDLSGLHYETGIDEAERTVWVRVPLEDKKTGPVMGVILALVLQEADIRLELSRATKRGMELVLAP